MTLVAIAEKDELKLVEELGYGNFPIIITGVGGMNVIRTLKDLPKDTSIVNIGYAGSNNLPVGTKVQVSRSHTYHPNADFYEDEESCQYCGGLMKVDCYTSTDFVTETSIQNPCVFDMELAFICSMFEDVTAIKVVSDNLNKKEYNKTIKGE